MNSKYKICLFGCGSLGSNTALTIARRLGQDVSFYLLDRDVIENKNLSNQPWLDFNVGQKKNTVLATNIWHTAKVSCECLHIDLDSSKSQRVVKLLEINKPNLLIDCFDNEGARALTETISSNLSIEVLHAGFSETTCRNWWKGEMSFNPKFLESREPVCDRRELAIIVQIGAALTAETAVQYLKTKLKKRPFFDLINGDFFIYK